MSAARDPLDRGFDVGVALTVTAGSVALVRHGEAPPLVLAALVVVNAAVALSFVRRSAAIAVARPSDVASALPSVVASGLAYEVAAPTWPLALGLAHAAFAILTVAAIAALGDSFALLPARRALVERGPFRLVRNPMYVGQIGMIVSAAATRGLLAALGALGLAIALVVPRILAEERVLGVDPAYSAYRARVPHRLLPGLF